MYSLEYPLSLKIILTVKDFSCRNKELITYQPAAAFIIQDLDTLKTMTDAQRMQILEVVLNQTTTVKEIAEQLNQPARQLYYHINTLEKHGLIRVIDTRIVSGIIEKQ